MKGIIFDFNGTLFFDSHMHYETWRLYSKKLRGYEFTDDEMREKMFGRTNSNIIEYAIGKKPTKDMVEKLAKEKEAMYREMCKIPGKPAPDIYEIAARNLNLNPADCIVVKDAISEINSANAAGIGTIIAIASIESDALYKQMPCVKQIIHNFNEFDKNLFEINKKTV